LSAESNDAAYAYTSEPWTLTPDSEEWDTRIRESLRGFTPQQEGFAGQFAAFHRSLAAGDELPVTLKDARAVTEVITAVFASIREGAPVHLPIRADHPGYAAWQR
jgi:predicted dehydrogenase